MNNITKENIQLKSKCSINPSCLLVTTPFTNPEVMFPPFPQKREKNWPQGTSKEGEENGEKYTKASSGFCSVLVRHRPCIWRGMRLKCFIITQRRSEEMHFPTSFQILINQN